MSPIRIYTDPWHGAVHLRRATPATDAERAWHDEAAPQIHDPKEDAAPPDAADDAADLP